MTGDRINTHTSIWDDPPSAVHDAFEKNGNHALQFLGDLIRGSHTSPENVANPDPRHELEPSGNRRLVEQYPQWNSDSLQHEQLQRMQLLRQMRANSRGKSRQRSR